MKKEKVSRRFSVQVEPVMEYKVKDLRFTKVKIWLMHTGINYNVSSFDKEHVDRAIPTLANTPILAFLEENMWGDLDFSDHRMTMQVKDGEVTTKYLGMAVGLIPETNNARWETKQTELGELDYLVVDGLLWNKFDDPVDIFKRDGFKSQSMELDDDYSGYWDDNGVFHFTDFSFYGACILGEGVAPAMASSTIEPVFSGEGKFEQDIKNKLSQFNAAFGKAETEGGKEMPETTHETVEETVETVVESAEEVIEEAVEEVEATEEVIEETFEAATEETAEEAPVVTETTEEAIEEEAEQVEEVEEIDFKAKYNELLGEFNTLKETLEPLESFKREREENDLRDRFSKTLTPDELDTVFEASKDLSAAKIEEKLYSIVGKKNFSVTRSQTPVAKIAFSTKEETTEDSPYGNLFD